MPSPALSLSEIEDRLRNYPEWTLADGALMREYRFADFATAMRFVMVVGTLAERQNHHPEIYNSYTRVRLRYSTHDVNGISELDFEAVSALDQIRNP